MFTVRHATDQDFLKIYNLYKTVAAIPFGIARSPEEISHTYIKNFMDRAASAGIQLLIDNPDNTAEIVAEIHCYHPLPQIFKSVFSELTIAVHPNFQGQGLGKKIFTYLLQWITVQRPDILRIELFTQESNEKAIALYKKIGFVQEGRFEKRVPGKNNVMEADIPMAWFNPAFNV
ncbi:MAG: N-acetyltransferase [Chitinophagaceae bacterium]